MTEFDFTTALAVQTTGRLVVLAGSPGTYQRTLRDVSREVRHSPGDVLVAETLELDRPAAGVLRALDYAGRFATHAMFQRAFLQPGVHDLFAQAGLLEAIRWAQQDARLPPPTDEELSITFEIGLKAAASVLVAVDDAGERQRDRRNLATAAARLFFQRGFVNYGGRRAPQNLEALFNGEIRPGWWNLALRYWNDLTGFDPLLGGE